MAKRRMFSLDVVDTDKFLNMPPSTQGLYYNLGMRADDDGFVSSPRKIATISNCGIDDLNILISKGFLIPFESGVVVITDWKANNYIPKDRYTPTRYKEEKARINEKDSVYELQTYIENVRDVYKPNTECIQDVSKLNTQDRIDKDSKDKYIYIIDYLNEKAGTHFKPNTAKTKSLINARLKEGFTVEDFKTVIDKKVEEWKNDVQMSKYIRPETLFGTKFEGYLNVKSCTGTTRNRFINFQQRETGQTEDELENLLLDNKNAPR